ncbi:hypothetical protein GQR58_028549 [Nymphon striatum]|nr:hypothetical protein GQR58_028549 [Nymphon striatum]
MDPPISRNSKTFTALRRSGLVFTSRYPFSAVDLMVLLRSSSSSAPSRTQRRSRLRATLIFRVPSSTESSRFLNSRLSQTLLRVGAYFHADQYEHPPGYIHKLQMEMYRPCQSSWNHPGGVCAALSNVASACFSAIFRSHSSGRSTAQYRLYHQPVQRL